MIIISHVNIEKSTWKDGGYLVLKKIIMLIIMAKVINIIYKYNIQIDVYI